MKIDIVIPSSENCSGVDRLLESLFSTDLSLVEMIYVVINPKNIHTEQYLSKKFDSRLPLQILQTHILGVNHARNLGIKNCTAEIVLLLDDDESITDRTFFTQHLAHHLEVPSLVCLGGTYTLSQPTGVLSQAYHQIQMNWLNLGETLDGNNYHLLGGHISIKRHIFTRFLFDEGILFGGAETEFFSRLMRDKIDCRLSSELSVMHFHNLSMIKFLKKAYLQGRTHLKYSFGDTSQLHRKIMLPPRGERRIEKFAQAIYFFVFNIGRDNLKSLRPQLRRIRYFFRGVKRQFFWISLRLEFLTKKTDKSRPPDA